MGQSLSAALHYFIIIILFCHIFHLSRSLSRFSHAVFSCDVDIALGHVVILIIFRPLCSSSQQSAII